MGRELTAAALLVPACVGYVLAHLFQWLEFSAFVVCVSWFGRWPVPIVGALCQLRLAERCWRCHHVHLVLAWRELPRRRRPRELARHLRELRGY